MKNLLLTLTCLLLAAQTHASERYRVEVMIFAYLDENSAREEHWPLLEQWQQEEADAINTQLLMAEDTNEIIIEDTELNTDSAEEEIIEKPVIQPLDTLEFADPAARFRYRNDISMLWHQAWVEEIQNADDPIVHEVTAELESDIKVKLSGSIQFHRSRFIHITPNLVVEQFIFAVPEVDEENVENEVYEISETEFSADYNQFPEDTLTTPADESVATPELALDQTPQAEWIPLRAAEFNLSRRMRSDEVHYLDHPLLGLVVKVTPY